jgi:phosphoribosyl 1,2-cyclic phosphodiesterase
MDRSKMDQFRTKFRKRPDTPRVATGFFPWPAGCFDTPPSTTNERTSMEIRFWGVRGSIAAAGGKTVEVGGNTSCVEVRCGNQLLILDAGTGLRPLGDALVKRQGPIEVALLMSHFHWDHIQGFPFFTPAYEAGNRIDIYGAAGVHEVFERQMRPPHFPIGMDAMKATLRFHGIEPDLPFSVGEVEVRAAQLNHPNGCLAYRIAHRGRSVVYATDTEHDAENGRVDARLLALARGADALIYDAQYTPEEYSRGKRGWGHSTAEEGARLAREAGVGRLVLFHHDPSHDDAEVARIEASVRAHFPATLAAREGLDFALDGR